MALAWVRTYRSAPTRCGSRPEMLARVALVVGVCAAAYHYSLATLWTGARQQAPLAFLAAVPAIALLVAALSLRAAEDEPNIHDRYLDYIVGIPLVTGALAVVVLLPV